MARKKSTASNESFENFKEAADYFSSLGGEATIANVIDNMPEKLYANRGITKFIIGMIVASTIEAKKVEENNWVSLALMFGCGILATLAVILLLG